MKTLKIFLASLMIIAFSASAIAQQKGKPWPVADKEKNMKNPVAKGDASNKAGAVIYNKNCASCHGKTGLGDGVKARALKTSAGDFSGAEYQNQTDGELFYKTKTG